ncbi:ABC transporter permease subunit [Kordia jejudonensis]|uniref:ABC transporter permease subunit n=1 Tax=Kordia jejudonensis TaxID=1348245 RepID=UPI000629BC97|nr:ABC transporter permease subunit [Kordia jejudonensis]
MREVFKILIEYKEDFLIGISVTLQMTILIWVIGILMGTILGVLSSRHPKKIGIPIKFLTFFIGGVPVLVFLYWLHYPAQTILEIQVDGFTTTVFTLSVLNTFLVAEQVSSSVSSFPKEYIVSAEVCGLLPLQIIKEIQIPLIIKQILPSILFIQVVMMHSTLFGSLISVDEILRIASRVNSEVYKPVEVYTTLALFFLIISLPITGFAYYLKRKYSFIK